MAGLALALVALSLPAPWGAVPDASASPAADAIEMQRIAILPSSDFLITRPGGLDFDHDGRREFILHYHPPPVAYSSRFEFYECTGDDTFALAHVLDLKDIADTYFIVYEPGDVGDADADQLPDFAVFGRELNDHYVRLFEPAVPNAYPTEMAWAIGGPDPTTTNLVSARIADTDGDGRQEVVAAGWFFDEQERIVIYENDGNNSYHLSYTDVVPEKFGQSLAILDDFDGDGKPEIVHGTVPNLRVYESTGDDQYAVSWTWTFAPSVSIEFVVDAGDLDGDGRNELLVGGLRPNILDCALHILEASGDNEIHDVATLLHTSGGSLYCSATVADVDGDGHREIVFGGSNSVSIYRNVGDNSWLKIWTGVGGDIQEIGAGDHDGDGKDELIFRGGPISSGSTGVWEIDPAYAADMDVDGRADVVDNCAAVWNPGQEDADGDKVGDACDNCVYAPNPAQGPAVLGQTVLALSKTTFGWTKPADVNYVRGDLSSVASYAVQIFGSLPLATGVTDETPPTADVGFWYLVKPACLVGSWQSTLGAEPGRDDALP